MVETLGFGGGVQQHDIKMHTHPNNVPFPKLLSAILSCVLNWTGRSDIPVVFNPHPNMQSCYHVFITANMI